MEVWYEMVRSVDDYFYDFPRWRRISGVFHLPVPGSIIGLVWFCCFGSAVQAPAPASYQHGWQFFFLANMTILFLPPAVGIMDKFQVIAPYLLPIILIVLGAIVLNVCVIAVVVQLIKTRFEGDYEEETPAMSDLWSNPLLWPLLSWPISRSVY